MSILTLSSLEIYFQMEVDILTLPFPPLHTHTSLICQTYRLLMLETQCLHVTNISVDKPQCWLPTQVSPQLITQGFSPSVYSNTGEKIWG